MTIGLLKGHGGQELGVIAKTRESNANICIFRDIMRVPTAQLLKDMTAKNRVVPPSGTGSLSRARPGRTMRNQVAYSIEKQLNNQLVRAL